MTLDIEKGIYERLSYRRKDLLKYTPDGHKTLMIAALFAMYHDSVWIDPCVTVHDARASKPLLKITIRL